MNNKLYVGNLPYTTSEDDLRNLFSEAGNVVSVTIPIDKMSNRPRGFAFVEMSSGEEASKAINLFNGQDFQGRSLNVSEARPPENRSGGSGGYGNSSGKGGNRDRDRRRDDRNRY